MHMKAIILPRPIISGCNVNPVDGRFWKTEAVGSNPTTQTINSSNTSTESSSN